MQVKIRFDYRLLYPQKNDDEKKCAKFQMVMYICLEKDHR